MFGCSQVSSPILQPRLSPTPVKTEVTGGGGRRSRGVPHFTLLTLFPCVVSLQHERTPAAVCDGRDADGDGDDDASRPARRRRRRRRTRPYQPQQPRPTKACELLACLLTSLGSAIARLAGAALTLFVVLLWRVSQTCVCAAQCGVGGRWGEGE